MKHVIHPSSTGPTSKAAVEHNEEPPRSPHENDSDAEEELNSSTGSEGSSEPQPESDDHSWLPENWRQAALAGRRKAIAKITPKATMDSDAKAVTNNESLQGYQPRGPENFATSATVDPGPNDVATKKQTTEPEAQKEMSSETNHDRSPERANAQS